MTTQPDAVERYLTVKEAARHLQVTPPTLQRWIRKGKVRATMIGGTRAGYRVTEREVIRLLSGYVAP